MANRNERRLKHKLIEAPFMLKRNFLKSMNIIVNNNHRVFCCMCNTGWISMSMKLPTEAWNQHVKSMKGEK